MLLNKSILRAHKEWRQVVNRCDCAKAWMNDRICRAGREQRIQASRLEWQHKLLKCDPCEMRAKGRTIDSFIAQSGWKVETGLQIKMSLTKNHKLCFAFSRKARN